MTKKNAIIITITVVIIALFSVGYVVFFSSSDNQNKTDQASQDNQSGVGFFPVIDPLVSDGVSNTTQDPPSNQNVQVSKLRQISSEPVSGFIVFDKETETILSDDDEDTEDEVIVDSETIVRYIERSTGHIYESRVRDPEVERITNTTIPKIYEAFMFSDGEGVVLRYLDPAGSIETFVAEVVSQATTTDVLGDEGDFSDLKGIFIPNNISYITKSANSDDFFYMKNGEGYTFAATSPQNQTKIIESTILEWKLSWTSPSILLTTIPSSIYEGIAFTLNPRGGSLNEVLDDKSGLSVLSNLDNTLLLYSESINQGIDTGVYDLETKTSRGLIFNTLAEKCVWDKNNSQVFYCAVPQNISTENLPDTWYLGLVSFTDQLFKVDLENDTVTQLVGVVNSFDMTDLQVSENGDYVVFINKKDLSLWSLDTIE
ncbi:MAG: hypothetical protein O3B87_05980 [bacterium]|nr:hypothetical protein [bacterium]